MTFVCHYCSWMYCFNMKMSLFLTTAISQGSAATRLKYDGHCNNHFLANFVMNSTVKNFENPPIAAQVLGKSIEVPFWLTVTQCIWNYLNQIDLCYISALELTVENLWNLLAASKLSTPQSPTLHHVYKHYQYQSLLPAKSAKFRENSNSSGSSRIIDVGANWKRL